MYRVLRHVSYEACIEVSGPGGLSGYAGREEMALGATYVTVRASLGWAADAEETMDEILEVGDVCAGGPGYEAERWFAGGTALCERAAAVLDVALTLLVLERCLCGHADEAVLVRAVLLVWRKETD